MVVAGRNPAGVLYGQRLPCHSVFSHSGISPFNHPAFRSQPDFRLLCLFNTNILYTGSVCSDWCNIYCIMPV
jgi:hypothetical protein